LKGVGFSPGTVGSHGGVLSRVENDGLDQEEAREETGRPTKGMDDLG
jgi:hypothetical protein